MKLSTRLKQLREELGLTQEQMGQQGFVSQPGWIKLENGQRSPSEKLICKLCDWLPSQGWTENYATMVRSELVALKYLNDSSETVREAFAIYIKVSFSTEDYTRLLAVERPIKSRRGRPVTKK